MKPTIVYLYRGRVERPTKGKGMPSYTWHDGYSENGAGGLACYPWSTKRECQAEAKAQGCRAVFLREKS